MISISAPLVTDRLESRPCPRFGPGAECGKLRRAWDPTGEVRGRVGIGYVLFGARDQTRPVLGTILAHEGGPGYAASGTISSYLKLMDPLLDRRNLLVVDQRGTGRSAPIDCPELQDLYGPYADAAAICGARLGDRAHLFGTELAVDDTVAVIEALGLGPVDLYGDSYGTFFAQVMVGRHPTVARTVTLDAAYPTYGEDAWFPTQAPALRRSLEAVCGRSAWCQVGSSVGRLEAVVDALRSDPIDGVAPGGDGLLHRVLLDPASLARIAYNGTYVPTTYRELDAGLRAALDDDWLPLLRLLAEADYPGGGVWPPSAYSEGLDAAVSCRDYPQVFDLTADRATREAQLAAAITEKESTDPELFAPFTVREQVRSKWMFIDWCTGWPVPPPAYPPGPPEPPSGEYPDVPTLVLSGELDTITTAAEGMWVADLFPGATYVEMANGLHVAALEELDGCASSIVRAFIRSAAVGDISCAAGLPPIRTAPPFWSSVAAAVPAEPVDGQVADAGGRARLRAASVAVATAGDALARWWQSYESSGRGLRGGGWTTRGYRVVETTLDAYELASDLEVSGVVRWNRATGRVLGDLELDGATSATSGSVQVGWNSIEPGARATVRGVIGDKSINATTLAP